MRRTIVLALAFFVIASEVTQAQRYTTSDGRLRVALSKQPFSPTGISSGPNTMANGGIQQILEGMGVTLRIEEAALTPNEETEYGGESHDRWCDSRRESPRAFYSHKKAQKHKMK